jgi:hypothetical protein
VHHDHPPVARVSVAPVLVEGAVVVEGRGEVEVEQGCGSGSAAADDVVDAVVA